MARKSSRLSPTSSYSFRCRRCARGGDALLLAQHFLVRYAARASKSVVGLSPHAAERLLAYAWPGNVRELQNCLERAVALTRYDHIAVDDLPERIRDYRQSHVLIVSDDPSDLAPMEEVERRYIRRVMEAVQGNKTAAHASSATTGSACIASSRSSASRTREPGPGTSAAFS